MEIVHRGSCLCGRVMFEVSGALPSPMACHCVQCRKQTGHYEASVDLPKDSLNVDGIENVTWYRSSEKFERGFCFHCGSTLFGKPTFKDWISVAMGAFDGPTHTQISRHIFVSEKSDYYEIADGLPQNPK